LVILGATGFLGPVLLTTKFLAWIVAQITFGQFVHLGAFRGFGVGIPNGSLWTISVELSFYVMLPILYTLILHRVSRRTANLLMSLLGVLSFLVAVALARTDPASTAITTKLVDQTVLPYLYLFLLGILGQRNYDVLARYIAGKVLWWTAAYYVIASLLATRTCTVALGWCPRVDTTSDAAMVLVSQLVLAGWVFSVAFSARSLSERLLHGTDVSYGMYLYHMLIVNLFVYAGVQGKSWLLPAVIFASAAVGGVSWRIVEFPALKRKTPGGQARFAAGSRATGSGEGSRVATIRRAE